MLKLTDFGGFHPGQHIHYMPLPEPLAGGHYRLQHPLRRLPSVLHLRRVFAQIAVPARLRFFPEVAEQHLPPALHRLAKSD